MRIAMDKLLTATEMAERIGVSRFTLMGWHRAGVLPSTRLGYRTIRFKSDDVVEALDKRAKDGTMPVMRPNGKRAVVVKCNIAKRNGAIGKRSGRPRKTINYNKVDISDL